VVAVNSRGGGGNERTPKLASLGWYHPAREEEGTEYLEDVVR